MRYEDLEIDLVGLEKDRCTVRFQFRGGGGSTEIDLPRLDLRLGADGSPAWLRHAGVCSPVGEGGGAPPLEVTPREVGEELFERLFAGPVRILFCRGLGEVQGLGEGLRIKLRTDLREPQLRRLANLPWELLFWSEPQRYLALSRRTPVVRHVEVPEPLAPLQIASRLRILVLMCSPSGLPALALERERRYLEETFSKSRRVALEFLPHATLSGMRERLLEGAFHGVHFMGHGGWSADGDEGVLFFEKAEGDPDPVAGSDLATQLDHGELGSLRFVVLNACRSGAVSLHEGANPFAGVAHALLLSGLPAVVAMQTPVSDRGAVAFSKTLYQRLAKWDAVDVAMVEARLSMHRVDRASSEWAAPVLFLNAPAGEIFRTSPRWPRWSIRVAVALASTLCLFFFLALWIGKRRLEGSEVYLVVPVSAVEAVDSRGGAGPGVEEIRQGIVERLGSLRTRPSLRIAVASYAGAGNTVGGGDRRGYTVRPTVVGGKVRLIVSPRPGEEQGDAEVIVETASEGDPLRIESTLARELLDRLGIVPEERSLGALRQNDVGAHLLRKGRLATAERALRRALELDPGCAAAHSNLGLLLADLGDYPAALGHLRLAAMRLPGFAVYHYNLGALLVRLDRNEEGLESLYKTVELDPGYAQAYNEIGNALLRLDRPQEARQALESGLARDASLPQLHKNLGRSLVALGEYQAAIGSLQEALRVAGRGDRLVTLEATYWLSEAQAGSGDHRASCRSLDDFESLEIAAESPWAPRAHALAEQERCEGLRAASGGRGR